MNFSSIDITTSRLHLRSIINKDDHSLLHYHQVNRAHLKPWEPLHDDTFYTLESMQQRVTEMQRQMLAGSALHLVLCSSDTKNIIGECHFTNVVRGSFQACYLGFSIDYHFEGQGLMHEALSAAIEFVFTQGQLHRIMANHLPNNHRSSQLLKRLGFEVEGRARSYLKINGEWADHILTARINDVLA